MNNLNNPFPLQVRNETFSLNKRNLDVLPNKYIMHAPIQSSGAFAYDTKDSEIFYSDGTKWIPLSKKLVAGSNIVLTDVGTGVIIGTTATTQLTHWAQIEFATDATIAAAGGSKILSGSVFGDPTYFGSTGGRILIQNNGYYKILLTNTSAITDATGAFARTSVGLQQNNSSLSNLRYRASAIANERTVNSTKVIWVNLGVGNTISAWIEADATHSLTYEDTRLWIEPVATGSVI